MSEPENLHPERLGPYRIEAPLGEGGMGVVYRAVDTRLDRVVALKLLPRSAMKDDLRRAKFRREARLLASLNHPNIATIYSFETTEEDCFLTMEYLSGRSLDRHLVEGPLSLARTLAVSVSVARALEAAHAAGVIHRDLKPQNVQVLDDGTVKVLDFGLALAVDGRAPELGRLGEAGAVGTPGYMSPEQLRDLPVSTGTDLFAFGCILFECLTGKAAFRRETLRETVDLTLRGEPAYFLLPEETPESLHRLLRKCLEKDPDRRLQSAAAAREVLEHEAESAERQARIIRATVQETLDRTLAVGDRAPDFTLRNTRGEWVRLADLRAAGPVVVSFYRGVW